MLNEQLASTKGPFSGSISLQVPGVAVVSMRYHWSSLVDGVERLHLTRPLDAEGEVRDPLGVDQPRPLERAAGRVHAGEQGGAAAEQDVYEVELQLVQEAGPDALLDDRRAAEDDHVAV